MDGRSLFRAERAGGVRVYVSGAGVSGVRTTGRTGRGLFVFTPRRAGLLRVTIRQAFECPKDPPKEIGIVGASTPTVTG